MWTIRDNKFEKPWPMLSPSIKNFKTLLNKTSKKKYQPK